MAAFVLTVTGSGVLTGARGISYQPAGRASLRV
jgi:hypothetical protein